MERGRTTRLCLCQQPSLGNVAAPARAGSMKGGKHVLLPSSTRNPVNGHFLRGTQAKAQRCTLREHLRNM
eukprot:1833903-Amphidinium_carterae.2